MFFILQKKSYKLLGQPITMKCAQERVYTSLVSLQEHPVPPTSPQSPLVTDAPFWHLHGCPQALMKKALGKGREEEAEKNYLLH